jgi:hypothetical protein
MLSKLKDESLRARVVLAADIIACTMLDIVFGCERLRVITYSARVPVVV